MVQGNTQPFKLGDAPDYQRWVAGTAFGLAY